MPFVSARSSKPSDVVACVMRIFALLAIHSTGSDVSNTTTKVLCGAFEVSPKGYPHFVCTRRLQTTWLLTKF